MEQTPVHDTHNPCLLKAIPANTTRIIEIGCSSGALAREYKKINPECYYVGVEIDPSYAKMAQEFCDEVLVLNIDDALSDFFLSHNDKDCWIFGDTLEHLKDPWRVIREIHKVLPASGGIAACIPNAQHWSLIINLLLGNFIYTNSGLLDQTHLRWFTRKTILTLFNNNGFRISQMESRIFNESGREEALNKLLNLQENFHDADNRALRTIELSALQYVLFAEKINY